MMKRNFVLVTMFLAVLLFAGTAFAETQLREVYTFSGEPVRGEFVEGEILVVLEGPTGISASNVKAFEASLSTSANSVAASIGAQAVQTYSAIAASSGKNIVHMKAEGKTTEELLANLDGVPGVVGAAPNYIFRALLVPNDPDYPELWGMTKIGAPSAWDISTGSNTVFVAVLDTGIEYTHPDLAANVGFDSNNNRGIDTINNDNDPMDDQETNGHSHGTHVAGTIGAVGNNNVGVVGVNWTVRLLGVKVLGSNGGGTGASIIGGLNYVVAQKNAGVNIRVANMSIGGWLNPIANPATDPYGAAHKAVSDAGIVLVVAAGNEYQDIDNPGGPGSDPGNPLDDYRWQLPYPASFQFANMITVASIDPDNTRSDFSNYSPNYVHLAAPGRNIRSTVRASRGSYANFQGTSMAAPHVAGAAALIAAAHPTESAGQIKARILNNVTPNVNLNGLVARNGHLDVNAAIRAGTPVPPPGPVPVTGVTLSPTTLNLAVGQSATLTANIIPANATNRNVTWWTSNRNIADGSPSGTTATVTGVAAGTATITVRTEDGDFRAVATVVVGGGGSGSGGGGGCSIGAGATIPAVLLLMVPLAMLLKRGGK